MEWYMEPILPRDGITYCRWAENWVFFGKKESDDNIGVPPLYIFQVACLVRCGIPTSAAATGINICWGILAVVVLYGVAWELWRRYELALGAALLAAVHPMLIEMSAKPLRESSYFFWLVLSVWLAIAAVKHSRFWLWAPAGGCVILATLTRLEGMELLVLGGIYLFWSMLRQAGMRLSVLRQAGLFYGGALMMMVVVTPLLGMTPQRFVRMYNWRKEKLLLQWHNTQ